MENSKNDEPETKRENDIEVDKTGHSPYEWDFNTEIEEEIIRADKITEDYAMRVVLIPEKLDMEQIKKEHLRKYASHEEFWDAEYFPYILFKTNGSRRILKVMSFHGAFSLPMTDPIAGELTKALDEKRRKFQISKMVYQMRDDLKTDKDYLTRFLHTEVDGREIFYDIKSQILFHLDIDEWVATTIALWIMGSHVYNLFDSYAYIYALAERGSGKSRLLKIIYCLSRLGKYWVAGRPSPLFRLVHTLHPTICLDETEQLNDEDMAEFVNLLNAGYERGAVVPRTNIDTRMVESFEVYCPKAIATTKAISPVLESRCLRIPMRRTGDQRFVEREPLTGRYKSTLDGIKQTLEFWAIEQGSELARMDKEVVFRKYEGLFLGIPPRVLQIMIPLLTIYDLLKLDESVPKNLPAGIEWHDERENLRKALEYQMSEHKSATVNEMDQRILVGLYKCVTDPKTFKVQTGEILGSMELAEEERTYFTPNKIGKALKKYAVPKTMVNGRPVYFYKMGPDEQVAFVKDLIKRYSINISELEVPERRKSRGLDNFKEPEEEVVE